MRKNSGRVGWIMEKINYGKETLKLIEQGFVVQESELRRCQEDHIEVNYTIDLFNKSVGYLLLLEVK